MTRFVVRAKPSSQKCRCSGRAYCRDGLSTSTEQYWGECSRHQLFAAPKAAFSISAPVQLPKIAANTRAQPDLPQIICHRVSLPLDQPPCHRACLRTGFRYPQGPGHL